jgi:hypothetical protein
MHRSLKLHPCRSLCTNLNSKWLNTII